MEHDHKSQLSEVEARARALETLLYERGLLDPKAVDAVVREYESNIGPHRGAHVVARSWVDEPFRERLLTDATEAVAELGYMGAEGYHLRAVENTDTIHNVIVCTLCSCYPWPVLGLPPAWYKSQAYRSRVVAEPRSVLEEFGLRLPTDIEIRVWDSTAEVRYLVLPQRPAGTEDWSQDQLTQLVTRDSMIGTGIPLLPSEVRP